MSLYISLLSDGRLPEAPGEAVFSMLSSEAGFTNLFICPRLVSDALNIRVLTLGPAREDLSGPDVVFFLGGVALGDPL